ncbi:FAD/NAD(P)-binding protein [Streptomyces sp. NPDC050619]|uniref:FAD/NAD(P)-binding protein n=1 Tax=Streptomyces sp. NPDC050619 TaxID=3157214 RepID=UPI0034218538
MSTKRPGHHIAVVGGGPMCTYALAHLASTLRGRSLTSSVRITVFERGGAPGAGEVHDDRQATTSYLNRVAGQIAFAPDESNMPPVRLLPKPSRPTFLEWCREKYASTGHPDYDLRPYDVPRRHVHGQALREMFERYVERLRSVPQVTVEVRRAEVTDVAPSPDGRFTVSGATAAGSAPAHTVADQVLFVTGHAWNRPAPGSTEAVLAEHARLHPGARHVSCPYPLRDRLDERVVPVGGRVVVRGLGLTSIDVVLHLTEGRGGVFVPDSSVVPHGLRYVPSGREPALMVGVSPSGVPVRTRPLNEKIADPATLEHRPVFFTQSAVDDLRRSVGQAPHGGGRPQLDFDRQLFPLVVLEMAFVHRMTLLGPGSGPQLRERAEPRYRRFLAGDGPRGEDAADWLIEPLIAEHATDGREAAFDWRRILDPLPAEAAVPGADWHALVAEHLRQDLARALLGNLRDPVKAACDGVWRDLRSVFGAAIDHGGLTAHSHRRFTSHGLRHYNRLSNGPGLEPARKLVALVDSGLLDLSTGPDPEVTPGAGPVFQVRGRRTGVTHTVDTVVEARVHPFTPELDTSPLYRNVIRHGLARPWRLPGDGVEPDHVPGALDLTRDFHPVTRDGTVEPRLTFLGGPVEGLRVFQLSAARPHSNSYVLNIAARWAEEAASRVQVAELRHLP